MTTEQPQLTRVDSAIAGLGTSPTDEKPPITEVKKSDHRRRSSVAEGVWNIKDLGRVARSRKETKLED